MRLAILAAALALAGCAFSADTPLFSPEDAVFPIADGAIVEMRDPEHVDEIERLRFRATPSGYIIEEPGAAEGAGDDRPVLFVAVQETPEEDYIIVLPQDGPGSGANFAFAWRAADGLHLISNPREFEDTPDARAWLDAHTETLSYGERRFTRREDVLAFHRDFIAPRFVRGGATPDDQIIIADIR